jgi:hypothetical protein
MKTVVLPNEEFIPYVISELEAVKGKTVTLPVSGRSMRPFLHETGDKALLTISEQVSVGDVVLAEISPKRFVLHRVIAINGQQVTLRGDGNLNNEYCTISNVKATALGFYRKGRNKLDSTQDCKWQIYSWIWTHLYPVRRYLLFICYPHIPKFVKK